MSTHQILAKTEDPNSYLFYLWRKFQCFCNVVHIKLQNFIVQEEERGDRLVITKKDMLLWYLYFVTLYSVGVSINDTQVSIVNLLFFAMMSFCQLFVLSLSHGNFIPAYFLIYLVSASYFYSNHDFASLKIIGIGYASHQLFFLFVDEAWLKVVLNSANFVVITALATYLPCDSTFCFQQSDFIFRSFKYLWILLYIPNYLCSLRIVKVITFRINKNEGTNKLQAQKVREKGDGDQLSDISSDHDKKKLTDALQSRDLFIANFSHEIRNLLNPIIGNIELLKQETRNQNWLKKLEACQACSEIMMDQLNDVLDMTKIEANKLELNCIPDDIFKMIERVWNISIVRIKQNNLKGELYVSSNFPRYLKIDSHRLTQVLLNLIGNASKFTKKGFVKLIFSWHENKAIESLKGPNQDFLRYIEKSASKDIRLPTLECISALDRDSIEGGNFDSSLAEHIITQNMWNLNEEIEARQFSPKLLSQMLVKNSIFISSENENVVDQLQHRQNFTRPKSKGIVKIEIIDSGCGVSQKSMKKLFQPFSQADVSITQKFGGTGLGLYITKGIMNKMGGEIGVYSKQNVGSNFCLIFPAETASEEEYVNTQFEGITRNKTQKYGEKIKGIIINNDKCQIKSLMNISSHLLVDLDVAKDEYEALDMFRGKASGYYSFIIVDMEAILLGGITFCKKLRQFESAKKVEREVFLAIASKNSSEKEKQIFTDPKGEIRASFFYRKSISLEEYKIMIQFCMKRLQKTSQHEFPKVLIVDDDPFNTSVIQAYLESYTLKCSICSSGIEAVTRCAKEKFDIILMDIEMPGMDGFTASKLIREKYSDVTILGVTGHARDKYLQKAKEHGMNNIETKPLDFKKILALILEVSQD